METCVRICLSRGFVARTDLQPDTLSKYC